MPDLKKIVALVLVIGAMLGLWPSRGLAQDKLTFPVGVGTKTIGTNMFWLARRRASSTMPAWRCSRCCCAALPLPCKRW